MIALQEERTGLAFAGVQRAACDSRDFHVVVNRGSVLRNGQRAAYEGDVHHLPLANPQRQSGRWRHHPIHGSLLVAGLRAAFRAHLHFIPPAQVDATVAVLVGALKLDVQFEIVEFPRGFQVGAPLLVDQQAVLGRPLTIGANGLPAGEVLGVEQRFGSGPGGGRRTLQRRGAVWVSSTRCSPAILSPLTVRSHTVAARLPVAGLMVSIRCAPAIRTSRMGCDAPPCG